MNRRSVLKRLGLLIIAFFVPISALGKRIQDQNIGFKCWPAWEVYTYKIAQSLISTMQEHLLFNKIHYRFAVSINRQNWNNILSEIPQTEQYKDIELERKGFPNFLIGGVPILARG